MKVASIGKPAAAPISSRAPVPELPQSIGASGERQGAPLHGPQALAEPRHLRAERAHRGGGVEHVLPFEQPLDPRLALGQAAEDQGAVRDRLVAGHGDMAARGACSARRCSTVVPDQSSVMPRRTPRAPVRGSGG